MKEGIRKSVVVPLDGSENALKTLKYLTLIFGSQYNLDVNLFHAVQAKILFLTITMPRAVLLFLTALIGFILGVLRSWRKGRKESKASSG